MKNVKICVISAVVAACGGIASAAINNTGNFYGNVGAQLTARSFTGVGSASGNFNIAGVPAGSTILAAYVHSNDWFNGGSPQSLIFNGNGMGANAAYESSVSGPGNLYDYRWDVSGQITGNGSYSFDLSGGSLIYMASLHVVYSHPSLPAGSVHTYEGAEQVGEGHTNDNYSFNLANAAAGPAFFQMVTQADDTNTTNESIFYNGNLVAGPLDNNIGPFASLISAPVVNNGVSETISIDTFGDWFGMHVALVTTTIPAPGSIALVGMGGLLAARRRR
jgi:hypothetical protein